MQDSTKEHFVKGQYVYYLKAAPQPDCVDKCDQDPSVEGTESGFDVAAKGEIKDEKEGDKECQEGGDGEGTCEDANEGEGDGEGEGKEAKSGERGDPEQLEPDAQDTVAKDTFVLDIAAKDRGVESTIIGVHRDDYPNIYYTIKMDGTDREKQTVAGRLLPRETKEEAIDRLAQILRLQQEEDIKRHNEILEEKARQQREAALKRKMEENAATSVQSERPIESKEAKGDKDAKVKKGKKNCTIS